MNAEIERYAPASGVIADPTGGRLVAWADAARAAHTLAQSLVRTEVVPEHFRIRPNMPPAEIERVTGNATAALMMGDELGLSPLTALRSLYVIRGQVGMAARMQVALVLSRGHRMWVESETDDAVTMAGHRSGDPEHVETVTWTIERARRAGFIRRGSNNSPSNYETQPRAMLYARAATELARRIAADVLAGIPEDPADEWANTDERSGVGATVRVARRKGPDPATASTPDGVVSTHADGRGPATGPGDEHHTTTRVDLGSRDVTPADQGGYPDDPPDEPADAEPTITSAQRARLHALFRSFGWDRPTYVAWTAQVLGLEELESTERLTVTEASVVLDAADAERNRLLNASKEVER